MFCRKPSYPPHPAGIFHSPGFSAEHMFQNHSFCMFSSCNKEKQWDHRKDRRNPFLFCKIVLHNLLRFSSALIMYKASNGSWIYQFTTSGRPNMEMRRLMLSNSSIESSDSKKQTLVPTLGTLITFRTLKVQNRTTRFTFWSLKYKNSVNVCHRIEAYFRTSISTNRNFILTSLFVFLNLQFIWSIICSCNKYIENCRL